MATWQIVVAVIAALIGGGLVWWRNSVLKDVRLMLATETTPTGAIAGKAAGTLVEIKGTITSSEPLEAEFSKKSCVWHRSVIEEEYRKPSSGPDRSSETSRREVHNSTRFSRASVDDGSGPVAINLGSATFEGIEVVNTFDKAGGGVSISLGPLTIGDNTIGHHKREEVVPVGHAIYVLATAAAGGGVGVDPSGRNPFIVSVNSEEERIGENLHTAKWLFRIALAIFAIGALLLIVPSFF